MSTRKDLKINNTLLLDTELNGPGQHTWRILFALVSLALMILVIYGNTFEVPFHFDDVRSIIVNKRIHLTELKGVELLDLLLASPHNPGQLYRPVSDLSFALNYYFGGDRVWGYHMVNISVHILASWFLFLFLYHTLKLSSARPLYSENAHFIALLTTFLWASNPVQTQAVTYIVQRMCSMAGMFYILAMYLYVKGRCSGGYTARIMLLSGCLFSGVLAIGCKENAIMLPVSLLIYDLLLIQEPGNRTLKRGFVYLLLGTAILVGSGLAATHGDLFSILDGYKTRPFSLGERLLTEPRVILFYMSLFLYPLPERLNLFHDFSISTSWVSPFSTILAVGVVIGLILLALLLSKKEPIMGFSILFFFLNHVIESTVWPLELVFEHRNYIPSMFFFLPFTLLFIWLLAHFHRSRVTRVVLVSFMISCVISQGYETYVRNEMWGSQEGLLLDSIAKAPSLSRQHANLAGLYYGQGLIEKAIAENQVAVFLDRFPTTHVTYIPHLNLAACYLETNQYDHVIGHCLKVKEINPDVALSWYYLGRAYFESGDLNSAWENVKRSLELGGNLAHAHSLLGRIYLEIGNPLLAISESREALRLRGELAEAWVTLGFGYKLMKDYPKAVFYFKLALAKQSNPRSWHPMDPLLGLMDISFEMSDWAGLHRDLDRARWCSDQTLLRKAPERLGILNLRQPLIIHGAALLSHMPKRLEPLD